MTTALAPSPPRRDETTTHSGRTFPDSVEESRLSSVLDRDSTIGAIHDARTQGGATDTGGETAAGGDLMDKQAGRALT